MKQCYWLRSFLFIIQGLKFSLTSTFCFCKMLVKRNKKRWKKNFPRNLKTANIANKADFS